MVNKIILQGRLVRDIELKRVGADNIATTEFTVAWSEKYKEKETKCFLRCKAWRGTAEFFEKYFSKGQELVIVGQMVTEEWETGGEKKSRTICNVESVSFCGSKGNNQSNGRPSSVDADGWVNIPDGVEDGELPFC